MIKIKVQFIPQGTDINRIRAGIILERPEKIVLIRNKNRILNNLESHIDNLIEDLKTDLKSPEQFYYLNFDKCDFDAYKIDYLDFFDCIFTFEKWFSDEIKFKNNEVSINLSTGTALVQSALVFTGLKYGAKLFYLIQKDIPKEKFKRSPLSLGEVEMNQQFFIPNIPVQYLNFQPIEKALIYLLSNHTYQYQAEIASDMSKDSKKFKLDKKFVPKSIENHLSKIIPKLRGKRILLDSELALTTLGEKIASYLSEFEYEETIKIKIRKCNHTDCPNFFRRVKKTNTFICVIEGNENILEVSKDSNCRYPEEEFQKLKVDYEMTPRQKVFKSS